jgi:ferredoxin
MSNTEQQWTVNHDTTKCALCVVCARNCPTQALKREQEGNTLTLYFNGALCDGCGGDALCEKNCPESAIRSIKAEGKPGESGYRSLFQSEMAQCKYCEEYFAPVRRLDVISQKAPKENEIIRDLCPICRRAKLVVRYIETSAAPGSVAEYRQGKDIIRRAKKRIEEEEQVKRDQER